MPSWETHIWPRRHMSKLMVVPPYKYRGHTHEWPLWPSAVVPKLRISDWPFIFMFFIVITYCHFNFMLGNSYLTPPSYVQYGVGAAIHIVARTHKWLLWPSAVVPKLRIRDWPIIFMFFIVITHCHFNFMLGNSYLTPPSYVQSEGGHICAPYVWGTIIDEKYENDMTKTWNWLLNNEIHVCLKGPLLSRFLFHTSTTSPYDLSGTCLTLP